MAAARPHTHTKLVFEATDVRLASIAGHCRLRQFVTGIFPALWCILEADPGILFKLAFSNRYHETDES